MRRARGFGANVISAEGQFLVKANKPDGSESVSHTGSRLGWKTMQRLNRARSILRLALRGPIANPRGWGRATLRIDFERELHLR